MTQNPVDVFDAEAFGAALADECKHLRASNAELVKALEEIEITLDNGARSPLTSDEPQKTTGDFQYIMRGVRNRAHAALARAHKEG